MATFLTFYTASKTGPEYLSLLNLYLKPANVSDCLRMTRNLTKVLITLKEATSARFLEAGEGRVVSKTVNRNCFNAVLTQQNFMKNPVEAFNVIMSQKANFKHPGLFPFIKFLKEEGTVMVLNSIHIFDHKHFDFVHLFIAIWFPSEIFSFSFSFQCIEARVLSILRQTVAWFEPYHKVAL